MTELSDAGGAGVVRSGDRHARHGHGQAMTPLGVYVHIPFCPSKCGYCDFNSFAMSGPIVARTVNAIEAEILSSPLRGRPAKTVFFGGGTPTMLRSSELARLLKAVFEVHPPVDGCEVTSEANPGTVDAQKFDAMRLAGFNRLSLGAQSFDAGDLFRLGRIHGPGDIASAVAAARSAGFDNINIDLIFGLPHQSLVAWRRNLSIAVELKSDHLSMYALTIEPNTRFYRYVGRGMMPLPDDAAQVLMYDEAVAAATAAGLAQYEISNFAAPGKQCRHNLGYWRAEEYAGYGPGAVGRVGTVRTTNTKHPEAYCDQIEAHTCHTCDSETLTDGALETERVMLGLRLAEGIRFPGWESHAGVDTAKRQGWCETFGDRIKLTPAGQHFCDSVALLLV